MKNLLSVIRKPLTKRTVNAFDPYEKRWYELTSLYILRIYVTTFSQPKQF